jgi:hypothetical protein
MAIATPAVAEISPYNTIYVASWEGQLATVDSNSGESTPKGASLSPDPRGSLNVAGIDLDGATGEGYAISYEQASALYRISVEGGPATLIGEIRSADNKALKYCTGLDVSSAGILVTCDLLGEDRNVVGTLDPTTAQFTKILGGGERYAALATDPTTGIHYGLSYYGNAFALDLQRGIAESVGNFGADGFAIYGADFDSSGVLWAAGYSYGVPDTEPDRAAVADAGSAIDNSASESSAANGAANEARVEANADGAIVGPALLRFNTADWSGIGVGPLVTADGESVVSPESLTIVSTVPPTTPPAPTTAGATDQSTTAAVPTLANTGADVFPAVLGGLAALLIGLAVALPLLRRARA